jgi:hypothetical protein
VATTLNPVMEPTRKLRLQAYLDPDLVEKIREQAQKNHRPESWEIERLLRLALEMEEGGK